MREKMTGNHELFACFKTVNIWRTTPCSFTLMLCLIEIKTR